MNNTMRRETAEGGKTKGPGYSKKAIRLRGDRRGSDCQPQQGDLGYKSLLWIKCGGEQLLSPAEPVYDLDQGKERSEGSQMFACYWLR
jgi:hypothetical protein